MKVNFYDTVEDEKIKFAVIISIHNGSWVFCKHKERSTYECPGGHREENEDILTTAKRELWEETGAVEYTISRVCIYSVEHDGAESFGMLYLAVIDRFAELPDSEIERIELFQKLPTSWTYPLIQPLLLEKVRDLELIPAF